MELWTARLTIERITPTVAARIVSGVPTAHDQSRAMEVSFSESGHRR